MAKNTQNVSRGQRDAEGMAKGLNLFLAATATVPESVAEKAKTVSEIRQRLAEAHDLEAQGEAGIAKAKTEAQQQIVKLYQLRSTAGMTALEQSELLIDIWGSKAKKDGTPSKTPLGLGKNIRDVVVRLYNARERVNGRDGTAFFEPIQPEAVKPILQQVENGKLSPWDAYRTFGELKSKATTRPPLAFDPARILKIAASLDEEGAGEKVRNNPNLIKAYGELVASLTAIGSGTEASNRQAAAEQAHQEVSSDEPHEVEDGPSMETVGQELAA